MIGERVLSYQIESLIGEGGVGKVYLATHTQLGRKVAIKVLNPALVNHTEVRERFRNEATTLSALQHINIITLYDYLEDERGLFLIMEFASGSSLDQYIRKTSGPIPEQKTIYFFNQILDGFAYAHNKGVIHRDIKPSNIIVTNDADIKILDFGIAKILKEGKMSMTKTGAKLGTVLYMSPEQVKGQVVDIRTDIYSLGITLFEMLTGRCPYDELALSEYEVYHKIVQEPLPLAKSFYPNISDRMQAIIDKATSKDPMRRFQTCEEFKIALNEANFQYKEAKTFVDNGFKTKQDTFDTQKVTTPKQEKSKVQKDYIPEKRERNNTFLYVILSILFFTSIGVIFYQVTQMNKQGEENTETTKNDDDKNSEKEKNNSNDDEPTDEIITEKTPEERRIDSLDANKKKLEEFIKILKKDRDDELLKGLIVDGQFESNELGEFIIQVTVSNQRKDAKFKDIIIAINYFDDAGKELKTVEKELEPLNEGQSFQFKERQNVEAAKFTCKLKSAATIDMEVPTTLDSLNQEMDKIKEKLADLKKIKDEDEL